MGGWQSRRPLCALAGVICDVLNDGAR